MMTLINSISKYKIKLPNKNSNMVKKVLYRHPNPIIPFRLLGTTTTYYYYLDFKDISEIKRERWFKYLGYKKVGYWINMWTISMHNNHYSLRSISRFINNANFISNTNRREHNDKYES